MIYEALAIIGIIALLLFAIVVIYGIYDWKQNKCEYCRNYCQYILDMHFTDNRTGEHVDHLMLKTCYYHYDKFMLELQRVGAMMQVTFDISNKEDYV